MKKPKKFAFPKPPLMSAQEMEASYPGGFTTRDEAHALTAYAFWNGPIEELHAGKASPLTDDPGLSRITDAEMKTLMTDASEKLAQMLDLRDSNPREYFRIVTSYGARYCRSWKR